jgi:hypothetical protein
MYMVNNILDQQDACMVEPLAVSPRLLLDADRCNVTIFINRQRLMRVMVDVHSSVQQTWQSRSSDTTATTCSNST